jgi:hypothetical protein
MDARRTEPRRDRGGSGWRRGAATAAALAVLTALAWAFGAAPGPGVAGQAEPTSTPIRLSRITPAAEPTSRPAATRPAAARPTAAPIVIVVGDEGEEAADEADAPAEIALAFAADDWTGAYYQGNGLWYGRAWTAVYGAQSRYPSATLTFELDAAPQRDLVFTVVGLDDELAGKNPIALEVNGERVYEGDSPFESWDGNTANRGSDARWTTVEASLSAELFDEGENTITFLNLSRSGNFNAPPYNLLSVARLETDDEADEEEGLLADD